MVKSFMVCPFSKGLCIECAIYRGRHAEICIGARHRPRLSSTPSQTSQSWTSGNIDMRFDFEDFLEVPARLKNVEDMERRDS